MPNATFSLNDTVRVLGGTIQDGVVPGGALRVELIEEAATSGIEQFNDWDFKTYRYFFVMCPRHQGSFTMHRTLSAPDSMKLTVGVDPATKLAFSDTGPVELKAVVAALAYNSEALSGPVQVVQLPQAAKRSTTKLFIFRCALYLLGQSADWHFAWRHHCTRGQCSYGCSTSCWWMGSGWIAWLSGSARRWAQNCIWRRSSGWSNSGRWVGVDEESCYRQCLATHLQWNRGSDTSQSKANSWTIVWLAAQFWLRTKHSISRSCGKFAWQAGWLSALHLQCENTSVHGDWVFIRSMMNEGEYNNMLGWTCRTPSKSCRPWRYRRMDWLERLAWRDLRLLGSRKHFGRDPWTCFYTREGFPIAWLFRDWWQWWQWNSW